MIRTVTILAIITVFHADLAGAGPIRVSFLNTTNAQEDTIRKLKVAGCPPANLEIIRSAITRYYSTPFNYDTSSFPPQSNGFYEFSSASQFTEKLTNRFCNIDHTFELNCFDTTLLLASHKMRATDQMKSLTGPYLAVEVQTNGSEWLVPVASLNDVYDIAYPAWYKDYLRTMMPRDFSEQHRALLASLYQYHALPLDIQARDVSKVVNEVLHRDWVRCDVSFPKSLSVVMLHRARTDYHVVVSDHMGLLIRTSDGYMYLEKAGGKGPFLRIDTADIADVATYYSTMTWPDYPFNFMTLNDEAIMEVKLAPTTAFTAYAKPGAAE